MTHKVIERFFITALSLFLAAPTLAAEPSRSPKMTFGLEPTAGTDVNPVYYNLPQSSTYLNFIARTFAKKAGGAFKTDPRVPSVKMPNGDEWVFHNDGGAVEVNTPIFTSPEEAEKRLAPLYETFEETGVQTEVTLAGQFLGGGHLHVGREIFDQNPVLLRNVIVDKLNKPYIDTLFEEMGDDQALSFRDSGQLDEFKNALESLDEAFRSDHPPDLKKIQKELPQGRYTSVNTMNIATGELPTIELRAFRPPRNARQAALRIKFMQAYLARLDKNKGFIPLKELSASELADMESPHGAWKHMQRELRELGLDPQEFMSEWEARFPKIVERRSSSGVVEIRPGRQSIQRTVLEVTVNALDGADVILEYKDKKFSPVLKNEEGTKKHFVFELPIRPSESVSELKYTVLNGSRAIIPSLSHQETIQWYGKPGKAGASNEAVMELLASSKAKEQLLGLILCQKPSEIPEAQKVLDRLLSERNMNTELTEQVLSQERWSRHPKTPEWMERLMATNEVDYHLALNVLSQEHWARHPKGAELVGKMISRNRSAFYLAQSVLNKEHWAKHPEGAELLFMLIQKSNSNTTIAEKVLTEEHWIRHPLAAKILEALIDAGDANYAICKYVLSDERWAKHPEAPRLLEKIVAAGNAETAVSEYVLRTSFWKDRLASTGNPCSLSRELRDLLRP